jgi:hypothetical protein
MAVQSVQFEGLGFDTQWISQSVRCPRLVPVESRSANESYLPHNKTKVSQIDTHI